MIVILLLLLLYPKLNPTMFPLWIPVLDPPRSRHVPPRSARRCLASGIRRRRHGARRQKGWNQQKLGKKAEKLEIFGENVFKILVFSKQTQCANKKGLKLNWACCDIPGKLADKKNWTQAFWTSCYENLTLKHRYRSCTCHGPWFISWNVICWPQISSNLLSSKIYERRHKPKNIVQKIYIYIKVNPYLAGPLAHVELKCSILEDDDPQMIVPMCVDLWTLNPPNPKVCRL